MKNGQLVKNNIFGFLIGIIMMSGVGVMAIDYIYKSDDVLYQAEGEKISVQSALNDLYTKSNSIEKKIVRKLYSNTDAPTITFDFSDIPDYSKFTIDNFQIEGGSYWQVSSASNSYCATAISNKSYNNSTGILSVTVKYEHNIGLSYSTEPVVVILTT